MPAETRPRVDKPALDLPPPYRLVTLREVGDAFAHAKSIAAETGAGTLVYVGRFDLAEFAVVLEPDEPLREARRAFYAGMHALAEALTFHAPPEKLVNFDWPDGIRIDGGLIGGGRLGWPADTKEDEPPAWLVFGAMIRTVSMGAGEPGLRPLESALEDEGFDDVSSDRLVESFARHLMFVMDAWQEEGFNAIAKGYLQRLTPESGVSRQIDPQGNLIVRRVGKADTQRQAFVPALEAPSWIDPQTGGPR
jgi:biotin-(acetyl-CoA carboxylase) ligase